MPLWLDAALVVGGLFTLIALMPDFDGRNGEDWERHDPPTQPRRPRPAMARVRITDRKRRR